MKKAFILLIILLVFILSSCVDAAVSYELSEDNYLNIDYELTLSPALEDAWSYANDISDYWEDMGFSADVSVEDEITFIRGNKSVEYGSPAEAAAEFSDLLTDDDSFFYNVSFACDPSYFEDNYYLSASVSLKDIVRQTKEQNIPETEVESLYTSAQGGEYLLSLSLPGEVQSTNADKQDGNTCTWRLVFGEVTRIELTTKNVHDENIEHYSALTDTQSRDNLLFLICCIAAGVLLVVLIITLAVRKSRKSKVYEKRF